MKNGFKIAGALTALLLVAGCETTNAGIEQVRKTTSAGVKQVQKVNPFRNKDEEAQTSQTTTTTTTTSTRTTLASTRTASALNYQIPTGGPNTFSFAITNCDACPFTNVMIDPDNYWQRRDSKGVIGGQGRAGLYNDVTNAFQAQGFYYFEGAIDIVPSNTELCPTQVGSGQTFHISMRRNNGARKVIFDASCAGSASAEGAAEGINTVIGITDFADIVSGAAIGR